MTRKEALDKGFCNHCAAYGGNSGFRCGLLSMVGQMKTCILPADVVKRWMGEFGLDGETQRHVRVKFGDELPARRSVKRRRSMS